MNMNKIYMIEFDECHADEAYASKEKATLALVKYYLEDTVNEYFPSYDDTDIKVIINDISNVIERGYISNYGSVRELDFIM